MDIKNFLQLFRRGLAKIIDYFIIFLSLFWLSHSVGMLNTNVIYLSIPILSSFLEAFFLTSFGTTIGKALLGIKLQMAGKQRIPFGLAWKRSFRSIFHIFSQSKDWDKAHGMEIRYLQNAYVRMVISLLLIGFALQSFPLKKNMEEISSIPLRMQEKIQNADTWQHFSPASQDFESDFPSSPAYSFQELPIPKSSETLPYYEYKSTAENGQVTYSISSTELPNKWLIAGPKLLLKGAIKILAENLPNTKIVQSSVLGKDGHPVLDYKLQQNGNEVIGRLYLIGSSLYKVEVSYPPALKANEQQNTAVFLDSFKWIPKDKRVGNTLASDQKQHPAVSSS